ncbi:MAG: hypothetical protein ACREM2_03265 [Vulcanimicrobiaceae bacterium]
MRGVPVRTRAALACAALALAVPAALPAADVRSKIFAAFEQLHSYKLTVLGSVRSSGVWVAPDRYQMTTVFAGKPIRTIIIGKEYWTLVEGKWKKSGTASNNLYVDIAGLIGVAKANPRTPLIPLPSETIGGKKLGVFGYDFADGTHERCDYDPKTYRVVRCKADQIVLLYSGFNDPSNVVPNP